MSWRSIVFGPACWALGTMEFAGCVSSGTWHSWHAADARLSAEDASLAVESSDASLAVGSSDATLGESSEAWTAVSSCAEIVEAAVARSSALVAPRERARSALAEARAEGALPAPTVRATVWDFPIGDPSLADREGMYMLGVVQELPPSGLLDGRARAAVEEARESLAELAELRREVASEAGHTCVDWAAAALQRAALEAWRENLARAVDVATARFGAAGDALVDVARLERERAGAERAIRRAEGDEASAAESLRALLDLSPDRTLGPPPPLWRSAPTLDVDALSSTALATRGVLESARARVDVERARADAADAAASVPTFMVGGTYMQTPNARPGLMLELGMTLPWLWSGEGDLARAARSDAAAAEADVLALERRVRIDVRRAVAAVDAVSGALESLRSGEAPATLRALEAVEAAYGAGAGTLLDWLDAARAVRELELEEVELVSELSHRLADVESAVGAPLVELYDATERVPDLGDEPGRSP